MTGSQLLSGLLAGALVLASTGTAVASRKKARSPQWAKVKRELSNLFQEYNWYVELPRGRILQLNYDHERMPLKRATVRVDGHVYDNAKVTYKPKQHKVTPLSHKPGAQEPVDTTSMEPYVQLRGKGHPKVKVKLKGLDVDLRSLQWGGKQKKAPPAKKWSDLF
jgi:hypothetical protein